jgi:hypothetical protein
MKLTIQMVCCCFVYPNSIRNHRKSINYDEESQSHMLIKLRSKSDEVNNKNGILLIRVPNSIRNHPKSINYDDESQLHLQEQFKMLGFTRHTNYL